MQPITYTMDFGKIFRPVLAAVVGGILAAASIAFVFLAAVILQTEDTALFWIFIAITWSLFVFLSEAIVFIFARRTPFLRHLANILLMTTLAFGLAILAVEQMRAWLAAKGVEPTVDVAAPAWFDEAGLFVAIIAIVGSLLALRVSGGVGTLTLGDDRLTCEVFAKRWRWGWRELPVLKLDEPDGLTGRILGRHVAVGDSQKVLLTDVWNAPLEEILAVMNERRERVLAAGGESGFR